MPVDLKKMFHDQTRLLILMIALNGCGPSHSFSGSDANRATDKKDSDLSQKNYSSEVDETKEPKAGSDNNPKEIYFMVGKESVSVELGVVIDNSETMKDKYNLVRENIYSLREKLMNLSGVSTNVISLKNSVPRYIDSKYGIGDLSSSGLINHLDLAVGSYNLFALAASAYCPKTSTAIIEYGYLHIDGKEAKICGENLMARDANDYLQDAKDIETAAGFFQDNLAKSSNSVLLLVSDDTEKFLDAHKFMELLKKNSAAPPRIVAFVDLKEKEGTPYYTSKSIAYKELEDTYGASIFDINAANWDRDFDVIFQNIQNKTIRTYPLPQNLQSILSVHIQDHEIDNNHFKVIQSILTLDEKVELQQGQKITVKFL